MRRGANAAVFPLTYPERYAIFVCMKLIAIPLFAFKTLVLKPLDFLFYGGSGVLWRSRDEWRKMFQDALPPAGTVMANSSLSVTDEDDWRPFIPTADLVTKASCGFVDNLYLHESPFSADERL